MSASYSFQPIELSKILLCIYFASYFAENKEMLTIPTAQIGNRLFLDPRPLIPIIVAWGAAMAVIGIEDDIGFAALLFVLFIGLLWLATGRWGYLVLGLILFAVGAFIAAHYFSQVHVRVDECRNPWAVGGTYPPGGYQLSQGWFSMGSGGVGGTGLGFDNYTSIVPELTSDMVFAAIATGMGLFGAAAVVIAFILWSARASGRPDGTFGLLTAHGRRPHPDTRVPSLLHHGGGGAALAVHGRHPALCGVRRIVARVELHPHRAPAADFGRRRQGATRDDRRRCGRQTGRTAHGPGALTRR